ncbi:inositol-3-phosphate synthase, partial [bacterium]|nr:inositol-3-phosphate synthase [bacterium]
MSEKSIEIAAPTGKLGVLLIGLGAVSTTFIAGVEAIKKGFGKPIGSLTQMGTIRLGKRTENRSPKIRDFVPLAGIDNMVFGGWDIFTDNTYEAALKAGVLDKELLEQVKEEMSAIRPMSAVFDRRYVKKLDGPNVKTEGTWWDKAQALKDDIQRFKEENGCDRLVMVWCGSTEIYQEPGPEHLTIEAFEKALKDNHPRIAPSMVYAYAAISSGVPYANGAPQFCNEAPALVELARELGVPIAGKDFKTGQT